MGQAYQNNPAIDRAIGRMEGLKRAYHRDVWRLVEIRKAEGQEAAAQAEAAARAEREAEYRARAAAVAEHAQLTRLLLGEKDEDGTPLYTREEAQSTASLMQHYGVGTVEALDEAMEAECIHEEDLAHGEARPADSERVREEEGEAGAKRPGEAGPAAPWKSGEQDPKLGSFRLDKQCSGNEPDPRGSGE